MPHQYVKIGRRSAKTRSGCKRCKQAKLKCDEKKPECGRCQSKHLPCPGYNRGLQWSSKHEIFDTATPSEDHIIIPHTSPDESPFSTSGSWGSLDLTNYLAQDATPTQSRVMQDSLDTLDFTVSEDHEELFVPTPLSLVFETPTFSGDSQVSVTLPVNQGHGSGSLASGDDLFQIPSAICRARPEQRPFDPLPLAYTCLNDPSSLLVEFYFREVASLFSCFDSCLNPYRSTVAAVWTTSPLIYRTLQSMAAACLVRERPAFRQLGAKFRSEAIALASAQPVQDVTVLLAWLMLGQTSSWLEPSDLGIKFFKRIQRQITAQSLQISMHSIGTSNAREFFDQSLTYWYMLLSFVSSDLDQVDDHIDQDINNNFYCMPHPWTGVCDKTQRLLRRVGRLVRTERARFYGTRFLTEKLLFESATSIHQARALEAELITSKRWSSTEIVDPGDDETPIWHLQAIAEIYRAVGLLNLYRVFPDLLQRRYQFESGVTHGANSRLESDRDLDYLGWLRTAQDDALTIDDISAIQIWLTDYAVRTLQILETIPVSSRTRCVQPLLLVCCASELQIPPDKPEGNVDTTQLSSNMLQVLRSRRFVRGRFHSLLHVLPLLPTQRCLDLVEKIWTMQDAGKRDVYWIDVMTECGLQTTMG